MRVEARTDELLLLAGDAIARGDEPAVRATLVLLADRVSPRLGLLADSALRFLRDGDDSLARQLWAHFAEAALADAQAAARSSTSPDLR